MALAEALKDWDVPTTSAEGARRYNGVAKAIERARAYVYPRDISTTRKPSEKPEVAEAFALLRSAGRLGQLQSDFMDAVESRFFLVRNDLTRFLDAIQETGPTPDDNDITPLMVEMLDRMATWQRSWGVPLRVFEDNKVVISFTLHFQNLLYASLPATFPSYLHLFLEASLSSLPQDEDDQQASPLRAIQPGKRKHAPAPSPHLNRLAILPRYATSLMRVAYDEIERIVKEEAAMGWSERRLGRARQRVSDSVVTWMSGVFENHDNPQAVLRPMYSRFDYYLCKAFFDIRTNELFAIIVDFPDSMAALEDLRDCLVKVDQRSNLVDTLCAANLKRLLHPGAETKDVISQYISTIRCLRILDPLGVLLHKVAEPIRRHLRGRPDTIRCIVEALVKGEELQDENDPASLDPLSSSNDNTVERFWDAKWDPEPNDAAPEFRTGKAADIVGTLVSIYETKEVIVKELQAFLAQRLLAITDYDAVKEIRTIELLKIRFGEEALHVCDVMLKDMADSKRIDDHVHGDIESEVHPLIISRMFWPDLPASSLRLTSKLEEVQADYEGAFHHFKPDKRLRWLQSLGKVTVELEFDDRVVSEEVTPLEAAVAELFESAEERTEAELEAELGVDNIAIQNACAVWAGYGVLKNVEEGVWRLLETAEERGDAHVYVPKVSPFAFDGRRNAQVVDFHWTYIKGMLSNLGPQTLDMLQQHMSSMDSNYNRTTDELAQILDAAKRDGQVERRSDKTWALL